MNKKVTELLISVMIDNEFKKTSDKILDTLRENSIDHFVAYEIFNNVCINMYVGIKTKVVREKYTTFIILEDDVIDYGERIRIPNESILKFEMQECIKMDRTI